MSYILFTDLDGTLLDDQKQVCEKNRNAILDLIAAGHKIVITTGRPLSSALIQAERLNLTFEGCYIIAFNGSEIYDIFHRKLIYRNPLSAETALRIFDFSRSQGIHAQAYDHHCVISREDNETVKHYCRLTDCKYRVTDDLMKALPDGTSKILLVNYESHEKLEEIRKQLLSEEGGTVDAFFSAPAYLEIVTKESNKGVAVRELCRLLDIPLENSIAAGDGMNDIPMIKAASIGAAMKNAPDSVKAEADYITESDNNEGGVAEIIEKFIL